MRTRSGIAALIALGVFICVVAATPAGTAGGASGAPIPQGTQTDAAYAGSGATAGGTNVFATTQKTSCYTPEGPFFTNLGPPPRDSGMFACQGPSPTGGGPRALP